MNSLSLFVAFSAIVQHNSKNVWNQEILITERNQVGGELHCLQQSNKQTIDAKIPLKWSSVIDSVTFSWGKMQNCASMRQTRNFGVLGSQWGHHSYQVEMSREKQQGLLSSEDCWQQAAKCHAVHAEGRSLGWGGRTGQQTNVLAHFGFTGSMKFLGEASFNRDDVSELFKLWMCLKWINYW